MAKSSRMDACDAVKMRPAEAIVRITQRRNEIEHPLVLGQHVAGATGIDRIFDAVQHGDPAILDFPQRHHTHVGRRPLARQPARRILAADVAVPLPRVDQQQLDT